MIFRIPLDLNPTQNKNIMKNEDITYLVSICSQSVALHLHMICIFMPSSIGLSHSQVTSLQRSPSRHKMYLVDNVYGQNSILNCFRTEGENMYGM